MAGHSKWANIKHRKARQDAAKGKLWSKASKAIIVAAKNGGPDPDANLTLRYAIDEAKAVNMPKDNILRAIKKGSGETDGADFEAIRYEGYGPAGVAVIVDALTDNRNRTAPEIRTIFSKYGGNLGATGCVSYMFEQKGVIVAAAAGVTEDRLTELVAEAGGEDIELDDGAWTVTTGPAEYLDVKDALEKAGLEIETSELTFHANNTVTIEGKDADKTWKLIEDLEDLDDVQKVYANFEVSDEEFARLSG